MNLITMGAVARMKLEAIKVLTLFGFVVALLSDVLSVSNCLVMILGGVVANYGNGVKRGTSSGTKKRKRWTEVDDDVEDGDDHYSQHVTEEHYRAMLGEHMQRFKNRSKESRGNHTPLLGVPVRKSNVGINRGRNDHHRRFYDVDTSSNFAADAIPQRRGSYRESNVTPKYVVHTFFILYP